MNDILLNILANDSFTVSDFKAVGLTAENTKLESEDKYLQSQMIQENKTFKDDNGNFDKNKFHQYYLLATDYYNKLANDAYIEDLSKTTFYSKDNLFAPEQSKKFDETPVFITVPNPFLQSNSLTRIGKKGDRTLSISEIAQSQKIYNSKTETFEEDSVNDRVLGETPLKWFGDLFSEPLVIAQWDEDGEHEDPLTGEIKTHKKGDYKYNDEGTFYYETLNGRDVYGKQVLNRMNTLTVDGSKINRYDFFDSDDLEQKSVVGSVLRNLALVGSMFIPWGVGNVVKIASIATQSVGLMGALSKMFLGSENHFANNAHAWAKTVNRQSVSEYAAQNTWCWENLINLIGDSIGQIAEQRFLFTHVPALFKGTKGIDARKTDTYKQLLEKETKLIRQKTKKDLDKAIASIKGPNKNVQAEIAELTAEWAQNASLKATAALETYMQSYDKLGSILSKAYMTGIVVQDTYGEAKANGATDLEAFFLTLGYAAGELAILNSPIGEWMMPELHGQKLKFKSIANAIETQVKPLSKNITEASTPEAKKGLIKSIFNIGKRLSTDDYARAQFISETYNPMKVVFAHAAGESLEELSEEILADVSKSAFNAVNWLRGDETRIASAWENVFDRYAMSVLGGFLGGGLSSAATDFSYAKTLGKMTNEKAIQEIIYMTNNNQIDDFLKFINKSTLGDKNLSFDRDENGNFKPGTAENNQDTEIKNIINQQVKIVKDLINAEGAKFSENSLFDAITLKDLRYLQLRDTAAAGALFQEWNTLLTDIYKTHERINEITGNSSKTDKEKREEKNLSESDQQELKNLQDKLKDLRTRKEAIISGKRAPEFIARALFESQKALHGDRKGYTFEGFVKLKENKDINQIPEAELKKLKENYLEYRKSEMKNDIVDDTNQFIYLVGLASNAIKEQEEIIKSSAIESKQLQDALESLFGNYNIMTESENFDPDDFIESVQKSLTGFKGHTVNIFTKSLLEPQHIERLTYIKNAPISEIYTKELKTLDEASVIVEVFSDYIDSITKKFIDQGYIHPEVKKHLNNTYNYIQTLLNQIIQTEIKLGQVNEHLIPKSEKNLKYLSAYINSENILADYKIRKEQLNSYKVNLNKKKRLINKLSHTPVIKLLENFKIATSESNISVSKVIEQVNNLLDQSEQDISSFGYGEEIENQIEEVEQLIDLLNSSLYATRIDQAGVNNTWGYSKTLNELNKQYKNKEWVELAEIEGPNADLIQQDLSLLKQKLLFAKNLRGINNGQKLTKQNKVGYNKQYIFYNKFKHWVNELPDDLKGWNLESIKSILNNDLLLEKYNNIDNKERKFGLTPEEKIQIEKESLMIDDAIYKFFEDNSSKLNNVDELIKIINPNLFNLYDPATNLLNDEVSDLDDRQFVFSLGARAALKRSIFQNASRKTYNDKKAPVAMQEEAVYLNTAMIMNGDVINNFAKAYSKSLFDHFKNVSELDKRKFLTSLKYPDPVINEYIANPDMFQLDSSVEKFANIILTEGIAGSGKTRGVLERTKQVVDQFNPEIFKNVFLSNSTLDNAKTLMKDLNLKGKVFTSSISEIEDGLKNKHNVDLIRYFYSDYTSNYKDKVKLVNNKLVMKFTLNKDLTNLPKVIIIDEVSRYDYVQMKLLSEAAQHYGIVVLTAGDFDQISAESSIPYKNQLELTFKPHRLNFIGGSKLGLSFRTLNSQMVKNQKEVLAALYSDKDKINIFSWENESEIRGFKHYNRSDFEDIVNSINKIKGQLQSDEKIGFLYADEKSSIHDRLKEKFGDLLDIKSIRDAQGLEGNYYILDLNRSEKNSTLEQEKQELYTGITRAKIGGIIISDNMPTQNVTIIPVEEKSSQLESISEAAIAKVSQKNKEIFDKIFENYQEENVIYHPITPVIKPSEIIDIEDPKDEGIFPEVRQTISISIPAGTYKTREEAEKIDLSVYKSGYELYKNDELIGTIQGTDIIEHKDNDIIYYAPVVIISEVNGNNSSIYAEELTKYTLKNPDDNIIVPKYKSGDIFYDNEGNSYEIIEVINENPIKYKLKENSGNVIEILETDLANYSTIEPTVYKNPSIDLGENEDSETYKNRVEITNGTNLKPNIDSDGKITHRLYTFNGYETGVTWDNNNKINKEHFDLNTNLGKITKDRIDNANGLYQLRIIDKDVSKDDCLNILAYIHSVLMNTKSNDDILTKISKEYNLSKETLSSIEYGIKSSSKDFKYYGENSKYNVFSKNPDEKSEYANENVSKSDSISNKSFVAVFRNSSGKKVLEITLGTLNSPITLGQMVNEDKKYIYPKVAEILSELTPGLNNKQVFEINMRAMKAAEENNYIDLHNLFKAYLYTGNAFVSMEDNFVLAKEVNYGPQVIMNKGQFQKDATRQYSVNYIDLNEFVKDSRKVVSNIYIAKENKIDGKVYPIHKGYPGVFVSYNKEYDSSELAHRYMSQLNQSVKDVEFYYIIPPDATIEEYLKNIRNIYLNNKHGENNSTFSIGNKWTAYNLLKNVYLNDKFTRDIFKSKLLNKIDIDSVIEQLKRLITIENADLSNDQEYKDEVDFYKNSGYSDIAAKNYAKRSIILQRQSLILNENFGKYNIPIYKLFSNYLANAAYWNDSDTEPYEGIVNILKEFNPDNIKYRVEYGEGGETGFFVPAKVNDDNKYQIKGITKDGVVVDKDFLANDKIDTPMFEIPALTNAIGILADWEFENENDTNSSKVKGSILTEHTDNYIKNSNIKISEITNFDRLKENNKSLFGKSGIFNNIKVKNELDPNLTQLDYATEILSKFNSQQNNIGFAIVQPDGSVKMYGVKLQELNDSLIKFPEGESLLSLGGITLNKPLIFTTLNDQISFETNSRNYTIKLDSGNILFEYSEKSKISNKEEIKFISKDFNNYTEDDFKEFIEEINQQKLSPFVKPIFNQIINTPFNEVYDNFRQNPYLNGIINLFKNNEIISKFFNYLKSDKNNIDQKLNVNIGDYVIKKGSEDISYEIINIDKNLITLDDNSKEKINDLYKIDKPIAKCTKIITISYAK